MTRLALCALLVAACSSSKRDSELARMGVFKAQMCACQNRECADKVDADYQAWAKQTTTPSKGEMTEDEAIAYGERIDALEAEIKACKRDARRTR